MTKTIKVTAADGVEILDKYNVSRDIYEHDNKGSKVLKGEWIPDIIERCVEHCSKTLEPTHKAINKKDRVVILSFNSESDMEKFRDLFSNSILRVTADYIENVIGENPKNYSRVIITEVNSEGSKLTIQF